MKLISELRFLAVSTLVFMLISMFAVSYLFFYSNTPHHFGNTATDSLLVADVSNVLNENQSKGKDLFRLNCQRCHNISDQRSTGPGLKGVTDRITREQMLGWIHSPSTVKSRDPYFEKLVDDFGGTLMPAFPALSDNDIDLIVEYINSGG